LRHEPTHLRNFFITYNLSSAAAYQQGRHADATTNRRKHIVWGAWGTIKFIEEIELVGHAPVSLIDTRFGRTVEERLVRRSVIDRRNWVTRKHARSREFPGVAVYGAHKAALEAWTRYLVKENAQRRIRVNVVAPGAIDTEFGGRKGDEQSRKRISALNALRRLGEPDDIGLFVAALLSDDSRFLNAQRIEVSGGIV
jgi:NAD(P)-dependent dehydrogenase (short-subunit alcohol dehydrogenase family)